MLLLVSPVAAGATVALTAGPAHAALEYQGTFTIRLGSDCAQVQNNGRTDRTPIQLMPCDGNNAQRWDVVPHSQLSQSIDNDTPDGYSCVDYRLDTNPRTLALRSCGHTYWTVVAA